MGICELTQSNHMKMSASSFSPTLTPSVQEKKSG